MRALIADDEPIARRTLRELLEDIPGVQLAGEAATGAEAVEKIHSLQPDVAFLDLQMPGMNGFAVVRALRGRPLPLVVYVTAYSGHALEAFDAGAVDYLLKPVRPERLAAAVTKVETQLAGMGNSPREKAGERVRAQKVAGRRRGEVRLFDPSEVIAFQADRDIVYVQTASGRYYGGHTLAEFERRLPQPPFRRVHRGAIVNTDHIRRILPLSSRRWLLTMSNGVEIVVSKRMAGAIRDAAG